MLFEEINNMIMWIYDNIHVVFQMIKINDCKTDNII